MIHRNGISVNGKNHEKNVFVLLETPSKKILICFVLVSLLSGIELLRSAYSSTVSSYSVSSDKITAPVRVVFLSDLHGREFGDGNRRLLDTIAEQQPDLIALVGDIFNKDADEADVVRLYALYHFGGIYMDTDVEVVRPIDQFLQHAAFSGFEDEVNIPTGIMASEKGHPLIKELLDDYDKRPFLIDGEPDMTTNVITITALLKPKGFVPNNQYQEVAGLALYPYDYFCPRDIHTMEIKATENTYTIHHFAGSWLPKDDKQLKAYKLRKLWLENRFGPRSGAIFETLHFARKKNGGAGLASYAKKRLSRAFGKRGR